MWKAQLEGKEIPTSSKGNHGPVVDFGLSTLKTPDKYKSRMVYLHEEKYI